MKYATINFPNVELGLSILIDDDLYYNTSNYVYTITHSVNTFRNWLPMIKESEISKFLNFPILAYNSTRTYHALYNELFPNRISSTYVGDIVLNNYISTINYSSTNAYVYGNSAEETQYTNQIKFTKFPQIATLFDGTAIDPTFYVVFPVLPNSCIQDGKLNLNDLSNIVLYDIWLYYAAPSQSGTIRTTFSSISPSIYGVSELNGIDVITGNLEKQPSNFYANPTGYEANNGETVTPNFVLVYDDGTIVEPFTDIIYDENVYFKDAISTLNEDGISINISSDNTIKHLTYTVHPNIPNTELFAIFSIDVLDAKNPYFPDGDSTTGGGGGGYGSGESYFGTSGLIPNGSVEADDSVGSMYTRYAMNIADLNTVGNYFWSEDLGLQVAKTLISLFYGDPVQTIISYVSYPFNISNLLGTTQRELRWGGHATGLQMQSLNSNAFQIDWGSVQVNEYWGNFLDYSPFTKFQLYLPWGTGFVDIDPNDVMRAKVAVGSNFGSGVIRVVTNVEVSRGMCVHHVIANDTVIGSYSGSCGRQIPITGSDYASKQVAIAGAAIGAMTSAVIGAGSAVREHGRGNWVESATGNVVTRDTMNLGLTRRQAWSVTPRQAAQHGARVAANASRPAIAAAASVVVSPPHVSRSGSFQEGTGSLTIQSPYLIISRPRMSMPANYGNLYGYPSNIYMNLGSLSGYTEVGSIHLDGIPATMEELSEIDDLLKGGVIL